ncbi:MAG: hypothetical protein AAF721_04050 [Myxococcota bacterium]
MRRRAFLGAGLTVSAASVVGCGTRDRGAGYQSDYVGEHADNVVHILPTASHDRILVKVSLRDVPGRAPTLLVDGVAADATQTDAGGKFYAFDAAGLGPDRAYQLELEADGEHQTEPWALRTLPAPDAEPRSVRILVYTCAGGHDLFVGTQLPTAVRRRLLTRAASFEPDVVIANGDHVYWDLTLGASAAFLGNSPAAIAFAGRFDRSMPVLGTDNEAVLLAAVDNQVAELYGTLFRGTPVFFVRDDHDYFDNDVYEPGAGGEPRMTFPPDDFARQLARATQWLYYPEFLPDPGRPLQLPGAGAGDRPPGINESFGTLRYGRLLESLLYDCKGFMTLDGDDARAVPAIVEQWLLARMAAPEVRHVVNVPSTPPGYTAGKFAEWYPDVLADDQLVVDQNKPGWRPGWLAQHDRLLAAASAMPRVPLFLAGDIHSHAELSILRSGATDLSSNPVQVVVAGTPGATQLSWPSLVRGVRAQAPLGLTVQEGLAPLEENGFNLVDVETDRITIRSFRYDGESEDPAVIDDLEPFRETVLRR